MSACAKQNDVAVAQFFLFRMLLRPSASLRREHLNEAACAREQVGTLRQVLTDV